VRKRVIGEMDEQKGTRPTSTGVMKLDCSIPIRRDSRVIDLPRGDFLCDFRKVLYVVIVRIRNSTVDRECRIGLRAWTVRIGKVSRGA